MSEEATYPSDAVPGRVPPPQPTAPAGPSSTVAAAPVIEAYVEPSVLATVQEASRNISWQKVSVGAAIGIGSAAVAAALLYANRGRKA